MSYLDKLVEYRELTKKLEEYRKRRPGWELRIIIQPNIKIIEEWTKKDEELGERFHNFQFRLGNIEEALKRLKDLIRYYEKKNGTQFKE